MTRLEQAQQAYLEAHRRAHIARTLDEYREATRTLALSAIEVMDAQLEATAGQDNRQP